MTPVNAQSLGISMIRHNPVVVSAVERIFNEERQFDRAERRSLYRETISRPVGIRLNNDREILCFSKNLSFDGIGVISQYSFLENTEAKIEIHSSNNLNPVMAAKLAWCKPFGEGWFVSGWHFLAVIGQYVVSPAEDSE